MVEESSSRVVEVISEKVRGKIIERLVKFLRIWLFSLSCTDSDARRGSEKFQETAGKIAAAAAAKKYDADHYLYFTQAFEALKACIIVKQQPSSIKESNGHIQTQSLIERWQR